MGVLVKSFDEERSALFVVFDHADGARDGAAFARLDLLGQLYWVVSCCGQARASKLLAEEGLADPRVPRQLGSVAAQHDAARLHDVSVMSITQRHIGILLGNQERYIFALVNITDDLENLFMSLTSGEVQ